MAAAIGPVPRVGIHRARQTNLTQKPEHSWRDWWHWQKTPPRQCVSSSSWSLYGKHGHNPNTGGPISTNLNMSLSKTSTESRSSMFPGTQAPQRHQAVSRSYAGAKGMQPWLPGSVPKTFKTTNVRSGRGCLMRTTSSYTPMR